VIYRLVALLALVALVVGVVVLSGQQREASAPPGVSAPLQDPGYSAVQARLVQTGADGLPVYTLDAAQIQQQPDAGLVELQQVLLGFRDPSGNQWTARAHRGELAQGSSIVRLFGDVHVSGIVPGTDQSAEFISEHIQYDTNAQIVSTHDPVTVIMSGRELNATGMVASLKDRQLQLESAVHGIYRH
jgi:LPS export ABC transporter protein LptC